MIFDINHTFFWLPSFTGSKVMILCFICRTFEGGEISPFTTDRGFGTEPGGVLRFQQLDEQIVGTFSCIAETESGSKIEHFFEYSLIDNCPAGKLNMITFNLILVVLKIFQVMFCTKMLLSFRDTIVMELINQFTQSTLTSGYAFRQSAKCQCCPHEDFIDHMLSNKKIPVILTRHIMIYVFNAFLCKEHPNINIRSIACQI